MMELRPMAPGAASRSSVTTETVPRRVGAFTLAKSLQACGSAVDWPFCTSAAAGTHSASVCERIACSLLAMISS
jgi:hypothetical protein